jgi:6-pyruvoyl-tetrahydropterin synthase
MEAKKHVHGHLYRVKIAAFNGPTEYGDWFESEATLRSAMKEVARQIGKRYYCETKMIHCAECEADESPKVISTL